ncbi:MAG TPA: hypothetical protein VFJ43_14655, partial [Bacteroidia bacterium]|nr:hypothetical protein [Bacteroidia bacterium]
MNGRIIFFLAVCLFLNACGNNNPSGKKNRVPVIDSASQKTVSLKAGLVDGIELFRGLEMPPVEMNGKSGDTLIYCSSKGRIEMADTIHRVRKLVIDLHTQFLINKVFLVPCPDQKWFV